VLRILSTDKRVNDETTESDKNKKRAGHPLTHGIDIFALLLLKKKNRTQEQS
jgi:hypothetical protein